MYEAKWIYQAFADLSKGGFYYFMSTDRRQRWKELVFSKTLARKGKAHKIAYIAVMTALCVVANMFFEFKFMDTQFSLTIFVSALTGILIGPLFGFIACFLGDLVGFLYHSAGFMYMPWIGLSMGIVALLSGFIMNGINGNGKPWLFYVKLAIVCVLTFLVCTVAINTTAFWLLYAKVGYWEYLIVRLFAQGQIWNNVVNYALLFLILPIVSKIKPLKIYIN